MAERVVASTRVLVGMEIHVQLATRSKMFTGAANAFGAEPNSLVDAQVLGLPGVLPVMNRTAVEYAIQVGLALGCSIARHTKWDRKSYYYPDLPKNYQISQYDLPLCYEGTFPIDAGDGKTVPVRIRRAHLEEDAGKLLHDAPGGYAIDWSIVDLNRAGTPLLEIVTEPDLSSGKQVSIFGQELQKLVQFLGVSTAQMQMGQMRFEPNINVHITDDAGVVHKTAITEIKNLNSFSVLERATDYEARRQIEQWRATGSLGRKSTYGWNEARQITVHQRDKENEQDYRYFPDPDLVPVVVDDAWLATLRSRVNELPAARRTRYEQAFSLPAADAAILAGDRALGDFFEQSIAAGAAPRRAANIINQALSQLSNRRNVPVAQMGITPAQVAAVCTLIDQSVVAPSNAMVIFEAITPEQGDVNKIATQLGLIQSSDTSAIDAAIDAAIAQSPKAVADFKAGKQSALGSLVGMVMKSSKGLNPKLVQEQLRKKLS